MEFLCSLNRINVSISRARCVACKDCEEGVARAPVPVRIIEKGLASDRVIIDTVVSKYAVYVPIYRQSAILKRETAPSRSHWRDLFSSCGAWRLS
jgi:transposase